MWVLYVLDGFSMDFMDLLWNLYGFCMEFDIRMCRRAFSDISHGVPRTQRAHHRGWTFAARGSPEKAEGRLER